MHRRAMLEAALAAATVSTAAHALGTKASSGAGMLMLVYPGLTALDLVGPQVLLSGLVPGGIALVAKRAGPVTSDTGLSLVATHDFDNAPRDPNILFVPGGDGTPAQMRDAETLDFLRTRAAQAEWITSVCTGSLILGAAGLLEGYRATSHWSVRDLLASFGATPVPERVVFDRNRCTAAGVSAGLDFALALGARLRGEADAQIAQLVAEYAPQPPFTAGNPDSASAEVVTQAKAILAPLIDGAREAASARR